MKFDELLRIVENEPIFETGFLLAGQVNPADVRRQLSRWVNAGLLYQLRRGVYALAPPYQKTSPHPFTVANALVRASYVSLQSALAYYGLIPEYSSVITSITTGRPGRRQTPLGVYEFRHAYVDWFHSYQLVSLGGNQHAFVATPEKALLDLIALTPGGDDPHYLTELRLQSPEQLSVERLIHIAERSGRPKLQRAAKIIADMIDAEVEEYQTL